MQLNEKILKRIIDGVVPVSDRSFQLLLQLQQVKVIPKGKNFIRRLVPDNYEYFLMKGICRSYLLNPEGEEITISFFQTPNVLTPHIARTEKGLSLLNFQAVTDIELSYFSQEALIELMIENLEIRNFANTVLQNELRRKVAKEIGLASMTAKERLIRFRADFDGLENLVPHTMISTYLGITNISLSRLRRELTKG